MKTIEREKRNGVIYRKGHGTVVVPPFRLIVFIRLDQPASAEHTRGEKEREPCRLNQETNEILGNSRGCIDFTRPRVRERSAVHPPPLPGNSGAADTLSIISKFAPTDLDAARPRSICRDPRASVAEILGVIRGKSGCAWTYRMDRSPSTLYLGLSLFRSCRPRRNACTVLPFAMSTVSKFCDSSSTSELYLYFVVDSLGYSRRF